MGDVYAPHDLSSVEMGKFKGKFGGRGNGGGFGAGGKGIGGGRGREWGDVCDVLGVEPVGEYKVRLLPFSPWRLGKVRVRAERARDGRGMGW